jgi:hypothetical protein
MHTIPDYIHRELEMAEVDAVRLKKLLPKYSEARDCCVDDILTNPHLSVRDYLLQYFHKHLRQIKVFRDLLTRRIKTKRSILTLTEVLPDGLVTDGDKVIRDRIAYLNGPNHTKDFAQHARQVSEVLLKAGFVYPYVHELKSEHPADFIEFMDKVNTYEREQGNKVNMQDRMATRFIVSELLKNGGSMINNKLRRD